MTGPKLLILLGVLLVGIGLLWQFAPHTLPRLIGWFGNLPGDIRYQSGSTTVYFPITSMILISLALSLIARLFR